MSWPTTATLKAVGLEHPVVGAFVVEIGVKFVFLSLRNQSCCCACGVVSLVNLVQCSLRKRRFSYRLEKFFVLYLCYYIKSYLSGEAITRGSASCLDMYTTAGRPTGSNATFLIISVDGECV